MVTTCVVVWIEICVIRFSITASAQSPPAWWCGLKSSVNARWFGPGQVTTCVVVWIEISVSGFIEIGISVTTCVVVWIEINFLMPDGKILLCHHLRGGVD